MSPSMLSLTPHTILSLEASFPHFKAPETWRICVFRVAMLPQICRQPPDARIARKAERLELINEIRATLECDEFYGHAPQEFLDGVRILGVDAMLKDKQ